jgi:hypothetical protein
MLRSIFAFSALLAVAAVHAQSTTTIRAANSVNNQILDVLSFGPPGSTLVLNTDESSRLRLESLVLVTNPTSVDLYAADNLNHQILFYQSDFCRPPETNTPCNTMGMPLNLTNPIKYPNGLSVDSVGNLFAVNDAPGSSPLPQVWTLTQAGVSTLIDTNTSSGGSLSPQQAVVETMIVGPSLGGAANSGDLLVVSNGPDEILLYPGNGSTGPSVPNHSPGTLVPQCSKKGPPIPCIPAGSSPQGIAFWPEDNSLLITTSSGTILKASFASGSLTAVTTFASGLPGGLYKIKTGFSGGARAFVAQSGPGNHGSILELGRCPNPSNLPACAGNPPGIVVLGTVTTNVAAPQGIAVTNAVQGQASGCVLNPDGTGGCDLLGGTGHKVLKHNVKGSAGLNGSIVEDLCVAVEKRKPNANGACGDVPQKINDVCGANFDETNALYIPGYYCGVAGGKSLIVVKTRIDDTQFNNTYTESAADANGVLFSANNPVCGPPQVNTLLGLPIEAVLWGPQNKKEGTIVATTPVLVNGVPTPMPAVGNIENACGDGHGGTPLNSLWVFGVEFDTTASELQSPYNGQPNQPLWNTENTNYTYLLQTVVNLYNGGTPPNPATQAVTQAEALLLTNTIPGAPVGSPPGCIDNSKNDFNTATQLFPLSGLDPNGPTAYFQAAANLMTNAAVNMIAANNQAAYNTTCDSVVTNNLAAFTQQPSVSIWNPSGQARLWVGPTEFTAASLILSNPAPTSWPPPLTINASCPPGQSCPTTEQEGSPTTVNNLNGSVNATNGPLNLTWAFDGTVATGCALNSDDGNYPAFGTPGTPLSTLAPPNGIQTQPLPIQPPPDGKYHQYTITCSVPDNTTVPTVGSSGSEKISATAWAVNDAWVGDWKGSLASTCSYAGPFEAVITYAGGGLLNVAWTASGVNPAATGSYQLQISGNNATSMSPLGITYTLVNNGTSINVSYPAACQTGTVILQ